MTKERRLTVGQVKAMLVDLDAEFPPLSREERKTHKVSEKRRAADQKKRDDLAILRAEVETLKESGMSLTQIIDVLAPPTVRKHLKEAREST
ncbi:hypothetical protein [Burkholderia cenocepacia]|uniref:hypothetical protein n=1 Tax=Burkholderia cenocepacia TaxID=95486 RepID=UPI001CF3129E|nr:hypothetical protein [Burkholderia cenocepacia]MCA8005159.1 hypothetical protein [Burkholderia cenocepacia]